MAIGGYLLGVVFLCSALSVVLAACLPFPPTTESTSTATARPMPATAKPTLPTARPAPAMNTLTPTSPAAPTSTPDTHTPTTTGAIAAAQIRAETPTPTIRLTRISALEGHLSTAQNGGSGPGVVEDEPVVEPTATQETEEGSFVPTPTLPPLLDADLSLVFDTTGVVAVDGEQLTIEFTVTNGAPVSASVASVAFEVHEPSTLVMAESDRGSCEGPACALGAVDAHESVAGRVVLLADRRPGTPVIVDADLSWLLSDSTRTHSYAEANIPFEPPLIWAISTNATSMGCGSPVPVGLEAVYAPFGHQLYAISRSSGEVLWFNDRHGWVFQPVLADGSIYFDTPTSEATDYYVRSTDSSDGTLNWERLVDGQVRGPALVYEGSVYYTGNRLTVDDGLEYSFLISLDATTGALNWEYRADKWIGTSAVRSGDRIYFGTYAGKDDHLYSIDARTGKLNRRYSLVGGSFNTPVIADEHAYVLSGYGVLSSMDLSTGEIKWEYLPEGIASEAILSNGALYFRIWDERAQENLSVVSIGIETGSLNWQFRSSVGLTGLTVSDDRVYVSNYLNLISLDGLTGNPNWKHDYGEICGPLAAVDGVLYGRASDSSGYTAFAIRAD